MPSDVSTLASSRLKGPSSNGTILYTYCMVLKIIFGSPTYHRDMAEPMKTFLFLARKANVESKLGGAFGSYTHDGGAPAIIFDTMQYVYKMEPFELDSFNLKEAAIETSEGMRSCQDYGRVFGEKAVK